MKKNIDDAEINPIYSKLKHKSQLACKFNIIKNNNNSIYQTQIKSKKILKNIQLVLCEKNTYYIIFVYKFYNFNRFQRCF